VITIAQLSDIHFDGSSRISGRVGRVLDYLRAAPGPIDVVLVTGDIADHGSPDEYEEAQVLLDLADLPSLVLLLPGNHDSRAPFASRMLGRPSGHDAEINQLVSTPAADFLLCDSTLPGKDNGRLSDHTVAWLDRSLTERDDADVPAVICFHHPPVTTHDPVVDAIRQFDEHRLDDVIRRHPRVAAVLCGHVHSAAVSTFAGVPLVVAPSVASTARLPIEPGPRLDLEQPPGLAIHVLDDAGRLVTHFRSIL
jgi:Icc protein